MHAAQRFRLRMFATTAACRNLTQSTVHTPHTYNLYNTCTSYQISPPAHVCNERLYPVKHSCDCFRGPHGANLRGKQARPQLCKQPTRTACIHLRLWYVYHLADWLRPYGRVGPLYDSANFQGLADQPVCASLSVTPVSPSSSDPCEKYCANYIFYLILHSHVDTPSCRRSQHMIYQREGCPQ